MLKDAFGERKGKCEIRLKAWRITRPIPAVAFKLWSCPLGPFFTNDKICRGFRDVYKRQMRRIGWLAGGPVDWFGRRSVRSGAGLIGKLWQQTRSAPRRDRRFKVDEAGGFL